MSKIITFNTPVDVIDNQLVETFGEYLVNLYKGDEFIEARHYKGYSGNEMMNEVSELKNIDGFTVEW